MTKLSDETLRLALPILERYRTVLLTSRRFDVGSFESELRGVWSIGYKTLKDFVIDMSEHGRFQEVAAYYMEHSNAPGVISEFKPCLARLYGLKTYHHSPDFELLKNQFWARAFGDAVS
jgi:hypothetical protein